jgi:thiamine biosynthesis lipoprotein
MTATFTRREVIRQGKQLAMATPFLSLIACDNAGAARRLNVFRGVTMGTTYSVKVSRMPATADRRGMKNAISRILETVNAQMSTYLPDSELSDFNAAVAGRWTGISADTLSVVREALRIARLTDGAFDPTIGPLVDLWGFGPGGTPRAVPGRRRIAEKLTHIGHDAIETRTSPQAIAKGRPEIRLDLSGIAKGFAVDKIAAHLERVGVEYYLAEIGGELRGRGYSQRGDVWRVGIERPAGARRIPQRIVRLGGQALATSGDYRIFFERKGLRYSHILDPRDGRPVRHGLASVTVIASTAMQADGLSTALMVLGPAAGLDLARREKIAAFFIAKTANGYVEKATPAFTRYLLA